MVLCLFTESVQSKRKLTVNETNRGDEGGREIRRSVKKFDPRIGRDIISRFAVLQVSVSVVVERDGSGLMGCVRERDGEVLPLAGVELAAAVRNSAAF